jgi:PKHD-type hydroxylase
VILVARGVLSAAELTSLKSALESARFVDGRASAGALAREQKRVLQLDRAGDAQREAGELVARALLRHPLVQAAALPKSIRHPTINRYEAGMHYGPHLDAPLMGGAHPMRADISVTVFLSQPSEYEGGELSIATEQAPQGIKAAAGDAVLYPSGAIHQVKPLESGVRLVAVTWLQSLVRSAEQRRLLFELGESIATLDRQGTEPAMLLKLRATYDNLLRMWAEG